MSHTRLKLVEPPVLGKIMYNVETDGVHIGQTWLNADNVWEIVGGHTFPVISEAWAELMRLHEL